MQRPVVQLPTGLLVFVVLLLGLSITLLLSASVLPALPKHITPVLCWVALRPLALARSMPPLRQTLAYQQSNITQQNTQGLTGVLFIVKKPFVACLQTVRDPGGPTSLLW